MTAITFPRQYTNGLAIGVRNALANGIASAVAELPEVITTFGEALARNKIPRDLMRNTNLRIAEQAQEAMAQAVERRSITRRYRTSERLAGGKLAEALRAPSMIERTSDNLISLLNPSVLNTTARHWARVNYGVAGPVRSMGWGAAEYETRVNGQVVMTLADREGPVPGGVYVPRRWRYVGGNRDVFQVIWAWRPRPGARPNLGIGARAQHFVDEGLRVVAREIGPEYDRMWRDYASTMVGQTRLQRANINITVDMRLQGTTWTSYGYGRD